jgi:hypothetical protein
MPFAGNHVRCMNLPAIDMVLVVLERKYGGWKQSLNRLMDVVNLIKYDGVYVGGIFARTLWQILT